MRMHLLKFCEKYNSMIKEAEGVKVVIDNREPSDFEPMLKGMVDCPVQLAQLETADFHIMVDDVTTMYIERKTWHDLAASIKDGRCDTQFAKLIALRNAGRRVLIIVEGKCPSENCMLGGMNSNCAWGKLRAECMRGMPIIMSLSTEHTAQHVAWYANKQSEDRTYFASITESFIDQLSHRLPEQLDADFKTELCLLMSKYQGQAKDIVKVKPRLNPSKIRRDMLHVICGKGKMSGLITQSIKELHDKPDLLDIKGQRLKATTIAKAKEKVTSRNGIIELLCCVPGCSDTRAKAIVDTISLDDLFKLETFPEVYCNNRRIPEIILVDFRTCICTRG